MVSNRLYIMRFLGCIGQLVSSGAEPPFSIGQVRRLYTRRYIREPKKSGAIQDEFFQSLSLALEDKKSPLTLVKEGKKIFIDFKPSASLNLDSEFLDSYRDSMSMRKLRPDKSRSLVGISNRVAYMNKAFLSEKYMETVLKYMEPFTIPSRKVVVEPMPYYLPTHPKSPLRGAEFIFKLDCPRDFLEAGTHSIAILPTGGRYSKGTKIVYCNPSRPIVNYGSNSGPYKGTICVEGKTPEEASKKLLKISPEVLKPIFKKTCEEYESILPGSRYANLLGRSPYLKSRLLGG